MAARARLNRIWWSNTISFTSKFKVYRSLCHLHPSLWLWNIDFDCWLWEKNPGFRNQVPEETSSHLLLGTKDQKLGAEQDPLPHGPTETSSGNCQKTETCMVWACHVPWQPAWNYPSGFCGGWAVLEQAEEMLDGQHQRVGIYAHARTAHDGLLHKRLEEDLCWIICHVLLNKPVSQGTEVNWTTFFLLLFLSQNWHA